MKAKNQNQSVEILQSIRSEPYPKEEYSKPNANPTWRS